MAARSCWPRWSAWCWSESGPAIRRTASIRCHWSEVEGQRQALFLAPVHFYPVRQGGREEEEIPGLGHQARRQLPVQQDEFARLVRHLDVVDAGEEFVVLVMIMDAGALSRPLGVEPEEGKKEPGSCFLPAQRSVICVAVRCNLTNGVRRHPRFWAAAAGCGHPERCRAWGADQRFRRPTANSRSERA